MNDQWSQWRKNNFYYFDTHLPRNKDLLDLGAGETPFWELFSQSKTYTGVDWKPFQHVSLVTDLSKPIPLSDVSYDIVTLSNVLEHILDPQSLLGESFRLLRHGGIIIGTVPFIRDVHNKPHDFYRYTPFALKYFLEHSGFTKIEITPLGTVYDVFVLAQNSFFGYFLNATNQSLIVRALRKFFVVVNKLFHPIFLRAPIREDFTEGYGFKATKL